MTARNLGIDVLRVFSVVLVVLSHYELLGRFPLGGTHGVAIFFMISGYCMYYSTQGRTGSEFLKARFWRLVPIFVICATVTALIEAFNVVPERSQSFKSYLANVFCLPVGNLLCDAASLAATGKPVMYSWVDGAYWSLLVEIRFYLLLWLLFYLLRIRRAEIPLAFMGLFAATNISTDLISKAQDFLLYLSFFSFGMAYRSYLNSDRYAGLVLVFAVLVFVLNCFKEASGISMSLNGENLFEYALCFGIFLASMVVLKTASSPVVSYLGMISYPLYLIHQDLGLVMITVLSPSTGQTIAALVVTLIVLAIASVVQSTADHCVKLLGR